MFDIFNMLKKEEHKDAKQVTRDTIIGDILIWTRRPLPTSWRSACTVWAALHPAARASRRPVLSTAWTAMS